MVSGFSRLRTKLPLAKFFAIWSSVSPTFSSLIRLVSRRISVIALSVTALFAEVIAVNEPINSSGFMLL